MFLIVIGIIIFVVWFYVLFLREWLVAVWPERFTKWHDIETYLWLNSRQILVSRVYWFGGAIVGLHEWAAAAGFDFTPIVQQITDLIPENYQKFVPLFISLGLIVTGWVFEKLRKSTTEPIEIKTEMGG
jgi:hypothetical protein